MKIIEMMLSSVSKIERSLCEFEKQIFGYLNLCYPDLKGRITVLKKKLSKNGEILTKTTI
jgi:DNA-binding transcriptional regulator/RsmH inhibitor MraZ